MESPTAEQEEILPAGNKSAELEEPEAADSQRAAEEASSNSPAPSAGTASPVVDYVSQF